MTGSEAVCHNPEAIKGLVRRGAQHAEDVVGKPRDMLL